MEYYDQHLHTHHSFDSKESFHRYLQHHPSTFVTTEHLDFNNPSDQFKHSLPDYSNYLKEIHDLETHYPNTTFLKGIEIGYVPKHQSDIQQFLKEKEFDLILLSVHQNGEFDFMDNIVLSLDPKEVISTYYTQMLQAVKQFQTAQVLTHFDYGVRKLSLSVQDFKQMAEPFLIPILKEIIAKNMALELNAKSILTYKNKELYTYIIPLYLSLGGHLFTLGSDAHRAADYEMGFQEMKELLHSFQINQLATYQKQQLVLVTF